jgi:hypothetical protein
MILRIARCSDISFFFTKKGFTTLLLAVNDDIINRVLLEDFFKESLMLHKCGRDWGSEEAGFEHRTR